MIEYRTSIKHDRALCDRVGKFEFDSHKKSKKKNKQKNRHTKNKKKYGGLVVWIHKKERGINTKEILDRLRDSNKRSILNASI